MTTKPESEWTLEDWIAHYTSYCICHATYKCSGCTMKELEASWRETLRIERESYLALNQRFVRCQKALLDAQSQP